MTRGAQDAAPLEVGAMVAEKSRVDGVLGRGGMGVVYSATHCVSDKSVALKWMLPADDGTEGTQRFILEARATARIDHPNVVDIYDVGVQDGSAYLVMERLHGEALSARLERGRLDAADAIAVLMPALRGVAAAHAQGVIHRDLKPDNIFLCESPGGEPREPKVLDFGISKIASGEDGDLGLTRSGMVMGTPHYMSPEQVRGSKDLDLRADIYGFGVILYEMLTDTHPFDADTYNDLIVKIVTADPEPIAELNEEVDPGLAAVVMRAMARDRADRFESVEMLALALEPYCPSARFHSVPGTPSVVSLAGVQPISPPSDASLKPRARSIDPHSVTRERPRSWLLVGLALVFACAIAWVLFPERPAAPAAAAAPPAAAPRAPEPQAPPPGPASAIAAQAEAGAGAEEQDLPRGVHEVPAKRGGVRAVKVTRERESRKTKKQRTAERRETSPARPATHSMTDEGALPADWDERLNTALPSTAVPRAASDDATPSAAGELSAQDL